MIELKGKYTTANIMIDDIEEACMSQIIQFINHPIFTNPIKIMPDTHCGKGSVIGFTMELTDKVISNIVGVDIGCGVNSTKIGKDLNISLEDLDLKIRDRIPFGQNTHDKSIINFEREFPWKELNVYKDKFIMAFKNKFEFMANNIPTYNMDWFLDKCKMIGANSRNVINSIGTLGGGNHYIEVGKDEENQWFTIHSGSRNFGKRICEYWQNIATKKCKQEYLQRKETEIEVIKEKYQGDERYKRIQEVKEKYKFGININGLEWLEGEDYFGYLFDMIFTQKYAEINRLKMKQIILNILKMEELDNIETVHNFIDFKDFIIRKGAIRSYEGESMVIPLNMRDGMLICEGKSNPDWNYSAPHGAGRIMSRGQAKNNLDLDEFKKQMEGIYSTSVCNSTLDEAPDAYKDSKIIEAAIEPTAIILNKVIPIHNMKSK